MSGPTRTAREVVEQYNLVVWNQRDFALAEDGLLYVRTRDELDTLAWRLCVPTGLAPSLERAAVPTIREAFIDLAHRTIGHGGSRPTLAYLRRHVWWSRMPTVPAVPGMCISTR